MKVSHYFEWERWITGGQMQSVRNQRKVMDRRGIDYTTSPDLEADVLHLNNMGPRSVYYAKRAQRKDVPVVIHTHQTAEDFQDSFALSNLLARPMRPYLEHAYSLADVLVCPSEYNRRTVKDYTAVEKRVISNGFDREKLEGFEEMREEYLDRYDLEPPVVFNVGHVIERKGLDTFIELAERMPELDFAWFGFISPTGGRLGRLLQSRSTLEKIEKSPENCTFTGYIEDIRGAFAAGDIFLFPTRNENEGIALLEAMGAGKPPVVRDIETFDWLEDGENCLKARDVEGFEEQLERMKDQETRQDIGDSAESRSTDFSLDRVGDELVQLYEELV